MTLLPWPWLFLTFDRGSSGRLMLRWGVLNVGGCGFVNPVSWDLGLFESGPCWFVHVGPIVLGFATKSRIEKYGAD